VGIRRIKLHVEDVGITSSRNKKTTSIFLPNPVGGSQSAPVQNIRTSSRLHKQSPAVIDNHKNKYFVNE